MIPQSEHFGQPAVPVSSCASAISGFFEVASDAAAAPLATLKKPEMAEAAAQLLTGTGWLPEVLRTAGITAPAPEDSAPATAAMEMAAA